MSHPDAFHAQWSAGGHPDEDTINAWLDRALGDTDAALVNAHVRQCLSCETVVSEARGYMAGATRIVRSLDTIPLHVPDAARVLELHAADKRRPAPGPRQWHQHFVLRIAASVLVVAGVASMMVRNTGGISPTHEPLQQSPDASAPNVAGATTPPPVASVAVALPASKPAKATTTATKDAGAPKQELRDVPVIASSNDRAPGALEKRLVSGSVTDAETGKPIEGVQVSALGTTVGAMTDAAGKFKLTEVPVTATRVQARRLGYQSVISELALASDTMAALDFRIKATNQTLAAVLVEGPVTPLIARMPLRVPVRCLKPQAAGNGAAQPLFRLLRGDLTAAGSRMISVVGWPLATSIDSAAFAENPDGSLRGTFNTALMRLELTLVPGDRAWTAQASLTNIDATRQLTLLLDADSSRVACLRE